MATLPLRTRIRLKLKGWFQTLEERLKERALEEAKQAAKEAEEEFKKRIGH